MYGVAGPGLKFQHLNKGIMGFQQGAVINIADMPIGRIDYGGESQRGWVRVDISGKGASGCRTGKPSNRRRLYRVPSYGGLTWR